MKIPHRYRGFTLIELTIVIAIMGLGAFFWARWQDAETTQKMKQVAANDLIAKGNVVNAYIAKYNSQLVNGTVIPGYTNSLQPTLAQLAADTFPIGDNQAMLGAGTYTVKLQLAPAGCTPSTCNVVGAVTTSGAIRNPGSGQIDPTLASGVVKLAGSDAGVVQAGSVTNLTGKGGAVVGTVPVGTPIGVVGMRVGYASSVWSSYCSRAGCNFTGNVSMGGNSITNASSMTANNFNGALHGNADTATDASHAGQADNATNAQNATHAGQADNATNAVNAQLAQNANNAVNAQLAQNANNAVQAQFATAAGRANSADFATSAQNANYATNAGTANNAGRADYATTAGSADSCTGCGNSGGTPPGGGGTPTPGASCVVSRDDEPNRKTTIPDGQVADIQTFFCVDGSSTRKMFQCNNGSAAIIRTYREPADCRDHS